MHASGAAEQLGSEHVENLDTIEPGSALFQALGDPVMLSYALAPALVNSVLLPKSARGVQQHERLVNGSIPDLGVEDILGRLTDTIELLFGIVYADEESGAASHALHELHRTVTGRMPDGSIYHAWNQSTWTNTWFVQVRAFMDVYGALRGYEDESHRLAVYRGFVELGRHFKVSRMPATLETFDSHWRDLVHDTLVTTEPARFLVAQTTHQLVKPSRMPWLPMPVWALMTLPIRRVMRIGLLLSLPPDLDNSLGIRRSRIDRVELLIHKSLWRLIPISLSSKVGPAYIRRRRHKANPVWRTRYSSDSLNTRRRHHEEKLREATE